MKFIILVIGAMLFINSAFACEIKSLEKIKPDMAAKLVKTDIKAIPCDSLQAALAGYNKSLATGGRRLESAGSINSSEQDSHKNICKDPEWSKRIASANLIADTDIRVIVTAAILDEAEEYVARDIVLTNSKVIPCAKN